MSNTTILMLVLLGTVVGLIVGIILGNDQSFPPDDN